MPSSASALRVLTVLLLAAATLAVYAATFVGCHGDNEPGDGSVRLASAQISAATGGTIAITEGPYAGVSIEIPAGALAADTEISINLAVPFATPDFEAVGEAFSFGPTGTMFALPVTISLPYTDSVSVAADDEAEPAIATIDESGQVDIEEEAEDLPVVQSIETDAVRKKWKKKIHGLSHEKSRVVKRHMKIRWLTPNVGPGSGGTELTIVGKGFYIKEFRFSGIAFGPREASTSASNVFVAVDGKSIVFDSPAFAGLVQPSVSIVLTHGSRLTLREGFTYTSGVPAVEVTEIAPNTGSTAGSTAVTITGSNFSTLGTTTVSFGGTAATSVVAVSATAITCVTPANAAGAVTVSVTTDGQTATLANGYTYTAAGGGGSPTMTSLVPNSGTSTGGTQVDIIGTNFSTTGTTTVMFGGVAAALVSVFNSTNISCVAPAHAAGAVTVSVTTGGQTATLVDGFTYTAPSGVTVTSLNPNTGTDAGGSTVFVSGTGFSSSGTTSVTFDGVAATNVSVVGTTLISCRTPARAAGAVTVSVTTGGQTATLANGFTYTASGGGGPTVTSVGPNSGGAAGGTQVDIIGTNFSTTGTTTVMFGGVAATNVSVFNSTTITCTAPAHAAGAVTVTVTTGGQTATLTNGFTYQ